MNVFIIQENTYNEYNNLWICVSVRARECVCRLVSCSFPLFHSISEGTARINDTIYDSNHLPPCRILIICPKTSKLGPTCDPSFFFSCKWRRNLIFHSYSFFSVEEEAFSEARCLSLGALCCFVFKFHQGFFALFLFNHCSNFEIYFQI